MVKSSEKANEAPPRRGWSRVDEMPLLLRGLVELYALAIVLPLVIPMVLLRLSTRIRISGQENLDFDPPRIYCFWHQGGLLMLLLLFPSIPKRLRSGPMVWISHPAWWARPLHLGLRFLGVRKNVFGSSGNKGRQAAEKLAEAIREGYSAALVADGPRGPAKVARKGALHIAMQTSVPIVPLRFSAGLGVRLPGWDRKVFPLPFTRIEMRMGKPIRVTEKNFEEAFKELTEAMGP